MSSGQEPQGGEEEELPPPLTGGSKGASMAPSATVAYSKNDEAGLAPGQESQVNMIKNTSSQVNLSSAEQIRPGKSAMKAIQQNQSTKSTSVLPPEICTTGECKKDITLGEPEKNQLKSVGRHLLKIGRQLLEEMNFVEGLLGRYGTVGLENMKQEQANKGNVCGSKANCTLEPTAEDNTDIVKAQLMEAIAVQAKRLNWIEKQTDEYNNSTKAAQFGSSFGSPMHSLKNILGPMGMGSSCGREGSRAQDLQNQDLKRRIAAAELKMEKLQNTVDGFEKDMCEKFSNFQETLNKMSEEAAAFREQVMQDVAQSAESKAAVDDKIKYFEAQIGKLSEIVWELKCETRAQMHFGQMNA